MSRHIKVATNGELIEEERVQTPANILDEDKIQQHIKDLEDDPIHPPHYQSFYKDGIDCLTAMEHAFGIEATAIFCKLNAFKYNWRAESKNGNEDIRKAIWYLNKYLELNKD